MAKLTRKSYQRKAMVVGATAFAGIALMATGFAAWVISSSTTKPLDGTVNIGVIKSQEIKINATLSTDKFSFEPLKNDTTGRVRWDGTNFESLTTTLTGDFSPASYVNKFTVQLRIGTEQEIENAGTGKTVWETNFETAAGTTKNYITLPEDVWCKEKVFNISSLANKTGEGIEDTKEFSQVISFGWGTAFGGLNPSEYYDTGAGKAVTDEVLKQTMDDFYAVMTKGTAETAKNSIPFRVIIKADTSAA